jgi:dCMP deaminase
MRLRPKWEDVFLAEAMLISSRSHDEETQHGCVITDREHRILSQGCNGFPRGMNDALLPAKRPDKYPWMLHSERNALANAQIRPENGVAYITGLCCNDCMFALWQERVTTIYVCPVLWGYNKKNPSHLVTEEAEKVFNTFVEQTKIQIIEMSPLLALEVLNERYKHFNRRLSQTQ